MMKPAAWKDEPGSGLENRRAIKPPRIEPPIPSRVVMMNPRCCTPGMIARAMRPMINPTMVEQIMWSIVFLLFERADYQPAHRDRETIGRIRRQRFWKISFGRKGNVLRMFF